MGDWTDLLPRAGQGSGIPEFAVQALNAQSARRQNDAQTQVLGQQAQALQEKAAQAQQYRLALSGALGETDAKKQNAAISRIALQFPDQIEPIKAYWANMDAQRRTSDMGTLNDIVSAIDNGRADLAVKTIDQRIAAEKAAGMDTSVDETWRDTIKAGDKKGIAYVRGAAVGHLAAADPARYSQNYDTTAKPGSPFDLSPGQKRFDAQGNPIASAPFAPRVIPVTQPDGSIKYVEYQPGGGDLGSGAPGGAPAPTGDVVARMLPITIKSEGGGTLANPAVSPKGARGPMQVMPSTGRDPGYGIKPSDGTPQEDARVGREYLGKMYQIYSDPAKAWAAYNAGPGRVDSAIAAKGSGWLSAMPAETRSYVAKNMAALNSSVSVAPQSSNTRVIAVGAPKTSGQPVDPVADADAITNDAEAMIQNGLRMPPGSSRNQAWVAAVKNRAAAIMKERDITPQEAMRGGQDFKAAQVMISGMAQTKPGTPGGIVRSINVGLDHMAQLKQAFLALKTGDIQAFNRISQWWQRQTGSPLPTNAQAIGGIVSGEMTKAVIGSAGALADREDLHKQLQIMNSPAQGIGVIDEFASLMGAQGQGLRRQYEATTGRKDFVKYLSPRAARLIGVGDGGSSGSAPVKVRSIQQARALPPGTVFIDPNGVRRVR